jgi:hypothetical protein
MKPYSFGMILSLDRADTRLRRRSLRFRLGAGHSIRAVG